MATNTNTAKNTPSQSFVVMDSTSMPRYPISLITVIHAFGKFDLIAQSLQVSNDSVQLGFAVHCILRAGDVGIGVWRWIKRHLAHHFHGVGYVARIHLGLLQPEKVGHHGLRHDFTRVSQMAAMPLIRILAAHTSQVRTGTLGSPLEWVVVHGFGRHRVVTITILLVAERANHLRVAQV